jgi:hypothetical protein
MKSKLQHYVQPGERAARRKENDQVAEEIQVFFRAVDSYPRRFAKEPSLSFHQHLAHFFETRHEGSERH